MGLFSKKKPEKDVLSDRLKKIEEIEPKKLKQQRVWVDPNEMIKFVCQRGKVFCPFCLPAVGDFFVTSNSVFLQDDRWVTTGDNTKINFNFKGVCMAPSQQKPFCPPPPCRLVIEPHEWKDFSDVHIDNDFALIRRSAIPCLAGGTDIRIIHCGQIAVLTQLLPYTPQRLIIAKEYFQTISTTVCYRLTYRAVYMEYGDIIKNDAIRWKIEIGGKEAVPLESVEEIVKEDARLTGNEIHFPVPRDWHYRRIRLIAYLKNEPWVEEARGKEIFVKNHIVAAFFRIDPTKPTSFDIKKVNVPLGSDNLIGPVHHHQGMFDDDATLYISGSTDRFNPCYFHKLKSLGIKEGVSPGNEESEAGNIKFLTEGIRKKKKYISSVLDYYRHPGGLQSANGSVAVGVEEYNYGLTGFFGSAVKGNSIVCFFNLAGDKEYKQLRIIRENEKDYLKKVNSLEEENKPNELKEGYKNGPVTGSTIQGNLKNEDMASAVGIAYIEKKLIVITDKSKGEVRTPVLDINEWLVAVRGKKRAIDFYKITGDPESTGTITHICKYEEVGEFQNLNLLTDEDNNVYMFGMGKGAMGDKDRCRIYLLDIEYQPYEKQAKGSIQSVKIRSASINEKGYISYDFGSGYRKDYGTGFDYPNQVTFQCVNDERKTDFYYETGRLKGSLPKRSPSFHWASCVCAREIISKPDTDAGYRNKLSLLTVNESILCDYHLDGEKARRAYDVYEWEYEAEQKRKEIERSLSGSVFPEEGWFTFEAIGDRKLSYEEFIGLRSDLWISRNPRICFNSFTEKENEEKKK